VAKSVIGYDKDLPEVPTRAGQAHLPPEAYLRKKSEDDFEVVPHRRPSQQLLVNKLRAAVDEWRMTYDGVSETTRRLLQFWFDEDHLIDDKPWRFYFGQREAIETLVYLYEVRRLFDAKDLIEAFGQIFFLEKSQLPLTGAGIGYETTVDGTRKVRRWIPEEEREQIQDLPAEGLPRYALKMATGSGKTVVIAMAMIWSYFHKRRVRGSQLSTNFLLLAPNVIVFQRLERDFGNGAIFRNLPLLPPELRDEFQLKVTKRGDATEPDSSGNLFFTNIHQLYESRREEAPATSWVEVLLGKKPSKDLYQARPMLDRVRELRDLLVLNDEAHHVWDEDLMWHQTLMGLHERLPKGLSAWLDFSATPRDQNGASFPWIVCDYPLAQAVEDRIVKAPIIVHQVDRADPLKVTRDNLIDSYEDWIRVALERRLEHEKVYRKLGAKPVLFVMAEQKVYADEIGAWLEQTKELGLKPGEVLVIHTDEKGNVRESQVEEARKQANEIDQPGSKVKVIVSVLMLREGWDVQSVTVVLGLRPFEAAAQILPEQAIGRGLRLLPGIGPDHTQTLEVIGTRGFEAFVRELEKEGVGIKTVTKAPKPPVIIEPVRDKIDRDIAIPLTSPAYERSYQRLTELDPLKLKPIWDRPELPEPRRITLRAQFGMLDVNVGEIQVDLGPPRPVEEMLASITNRVGEITNLSGQFAELYPIVKTYVAQRCFGRKVDLATAYVHEALRTRDVRDAIADYLAQEVGNVSAERRDIELAGANLKLSQMKGFAWRRDLPPMASAKTVFNFVATYNPFERAFAKFLHAASDVDRFASLGHTEQEPATTFRVDYVKASGATGYYFPDFVVVQDTDAGEVNWIIETKGRLWPDTATKDAAIAHWCGRVSGLTGNPWQYKRVDQAPFEKLKPKTFAELISATDGVGFFTRPDDGAAVLSGAYEIADPAVDAFLASNLDLVPLLRDVRRAIREYFGPDTQAAIHITHDLESETEAPELVVSIMSDSPDRLELLHRFDEGWWLSQAARERGRVLIDLAYR